ncbi:MAG: TonB-dependent receptor [Ignavibacteria bacterium]
MKALIISLATVSILLCSLPSFSQLQQDTTVYVTEPIEVDALRGIEGLTPITLQNIKQETIKQKYWMQDLPMFLNGNTSINAYSESGSSIGYSYFSIRGFDQRRAAIMLNGTPQNDAEVHQVFWVDLSDIASSIESIQIQRGIGTALYGSSSIAGVIDIQTVDYFKRKITTLYSGYGSYNSKKYSVEFSSGLTESGFGYYGKFSRSITDGYRDQSWSDHWSYFLSAGKVFSNNLVVKFNIYGSPIQNHLAYIGVTKDYLDGKVTGNKENDRKFNPLVFPNETDYYHQPHYELIVNYQPTKTLFISNVLNYMRGEGYFTINFPHYYGLTYSYFHLNPFFVQDTLTFSPAFYKRNPDGTFFYEPGKGYVVDKSDIVTNLWVNNDDYGWYPKLQWKHFSDRGTLVFGGELRLHKSEHFGEIIYGNPLPPGTPNNFQYYYFNGKKRTISFFANELFKMSNSLTGMLGVQYAYHKYGIENVKYKPYNFDVTYSFLTPRAGINYNLTENLRIFGNVSYARREPRLKDIYNAEEPFATPNFRIVDTVKQVYEDPLVKPEEMVDYELGFGFAGKNLKANINFYLMNFNNEIVNNGQLDNVGAPIVGNAAKSIHRGIEVEFEYDLLSLLKTTRTSHNSLLLSGNFTFSENYFKDYVEVLGKDSTGNIIYGNDYSGNKILLSPQLIANVSLSLRTERGINAYLSMQYISKQYLDNSENEKKNPSQKLTPGYVDKIINPYTILNGGISVDFVSLLKNQSLTKYFKSVELGIRVNNILDIYYESGGNIDFTGSPNWIPAAKRNYFAELKLNF